MPVALIIWDTEVCKIAGNGLDTQLYMNADTT